MSARDAVRQRVSIARLLQTEGIDLEQAGPQHVKTLCPLHDEKTPSFYINLQKDVFFCHGCSTGGDLFKFVQLRDGLTFIESVRQLAERFDIDLSSYTRTLTAEEIKKNALYAVNNRALAFWRDQDQKPLAKWLANRGLSPTVISTYDLAYVSKTPTARDLHTDEDAMEILGFNRIGLFNNTIAIPVYDLSHRIAAFRFRFIEPGEDGIKCKGPLSSHPLPVPPFYGLQHALPAVRSCGGKLVVVEGEPDMWATAVEWPAVVAGMGTKINDQFIRDQLAGYGIREIVVIPDGDDAGIGWRGKMPSWAERLAKESGNHHYPIRLVQLPPGLDPDDFIKKKGGKALNALIEKAPYVSEWAAFHDLPNGKASTTDKLDYLADIKEYVVAARPIEAELITQHLSSRFGLDAYTVEDYFRREASDTPTNDASPLGERILLAACIGDELARHTIMSSIDRTAFFLKRHIEMFQIIATMERERIPVGPDTVRAELNRLAITSLFPLLDELAGTDFANYDYHLKDIRERAMRRRALQRIERIQYELHQPGMRPRSVLEVGVSDLAQITVHEQLRIKSSASIVEETMKIIAERMRSPNKIIGWDLGKYWPVLNLALLGLQRPRYFVLAAPQGTGKTAFAVNMVDHICGTLKIPTMWFTFEMPPEALEFRQLSCASGVPEEQIKTGLLNEDEMDKVKMAGVRLHEMPLTWSREGRDIESLESIVRSHVLRHGIQFVVIDYIQLMRTAKEGARYVQLEYISDRLQNLQLDLNICILALCQINREGAKSNMARAEDVGGAYRIMQDADIALILQERDPEEVEAEGIENGNLNALLDKNRFGRGDVFFRVLFEKETLRMREATARSNE